MNTNIRKLVFRGVFAGALVFGTVVANAHHGNPQAPAPRWEGTQQPGLPAPQVPQSPGQ